MHNAATAAQKQQHDAAVMEQRVAAQEALDHDQVQAQAPPKATSLRELRRLAAEQQAVDEAAYGCVYR